MQFAYEAMRPDGTTVAERVEAQDPGAAAESLRDQGLVVLRLDEAAEGRTSAGFSFSFGSAKLSTRDLILFTRQMKMLLESGAALVPALEAAQRQTAKPLMGQIIGRMCVRVEEGDSLSEALEGERQHFDPVFRSMIAVGEATAALPEVFARLSALAQRQQQARKQVLGALVYPAILCALLAGVIAVLLLFVVPRFNMLFASLNSPLPASTKLLFGASQYLKTGWPYILAGVALVAVAIVLGLRQPGTRVWLDRTVLRLPLVGPVVRRLIFARVMRVWAAMLRCHMPLLDSIRQSREAVSNVVFLQLLSHVEESVSSGGRMGQAIAATQLADPVIASAISIGEENGRLAEAVDFVSDWLDDDNTSVIQNITRLAEPLLLAVMGVVVGFVALGLFVPLFDLATAA